MRREQPVSIVIGKADGLNSADELPTWQMAVQPNAADLTSDLGQDLVSCKHVFSAPSAAAATGPFPSPSRGRPEKVSNRR